MRKNRWFGIIFVSLLVLGLIFLCTAFSEGGQASQWTLLEKIDENDDALRDMPLKTGKRKYTHEEERIVYNAEKNITSVRKIKLTDIEREIALRILNLDTGTTEIIKITKSGKQIISPVGYDIRVVRRQNGIEWNGRNTHLKVIIPLNTIVIKIAWPDEKTKKNIVYSPYSTDDTNTPNEVEPGIHTPETVSGGIKDIDNIFTMACQTLKDRGVMSKAFPQYGVCELPFLPFKTYQRLILIEQMDESEFNLEPLKITERVLVILRTNRGRAFSTCNSTQSWRACGLMQFTDRWRGKKPGTYSTVVRAFPKAQLIKKFPAGAFEHINAAMAAILLHDINLKGLTDRYGQKIIDKIIKDPIFMEMILAAPYNGGPGWTNKALDDYFSGKTNDWTTSNHLRTETRGYLIKLRYLIENDLPKTLP